MPDLTVRGLPRGLLRELEASARRHGRTLSAEVVARLQASFPGERAPAAEILAAVAPVRAAMKGHILSTEEIQAARRQGRP